MKVLATLFLHFILTIFKLLTPGGVKAVMAENLIMRQQLIVLKRASKFSKAPRLTSSQRIFYGLLAYFIPPERMSKVAILISPATIFKFHRILKKRKYHLLFSSHKVKRKTGPKGPSKEVIGAVVEMKRRNSRMGCPKIALTISRTFDIEIDKDVVRRILQKHYTPSPFSTDSPSWLTFFGHVKDPLWSIDFFRVESINLKSHWVMIVMDQYTRQIIGFSAISTNGLDGPSICRMFNKIIKHQTIPKYLSSDNDPLFQYSRWKANLRIYEIEEIKSIPYTPISHPFIERLIGTVRREYLDHTPFIGPQDLEKKLDKFKNYYNYNRIHLSLKASPAEMAGKTSQKVASFKNYKWKSHCKGLFQTPFAA